ncbi:hypothetical protein P9256_02090 [Bacillus paralicheniformis]|uniref:hypothetical protein n=1 Tax=Bacillus paralicheniformis TaxID=1648923 RepID=UPI002E1A3025|nr:hypothetical protein [Bacillus paralicheniformis]MED4346875.1 hypothetical protein [Bacillus paralicheniformis]
MGGFLVLLIGGVVGGIIGRRISEASLGSLLGAVAALLLLLVPLFVSDTEVVAIDEKPIYALKDGSQVEGAFFIGTGTFEEEQYFFYVTDKGEGKTIDKQLVKDSTIIEDNGRHPKIVKCNEKFKSKISRFMFGDYSGDITYKIYVPQGTITTDFTVDMK